MDQRFVGKRSCSGKPNDWPKTVPSPEDERLPQSDGLRQKRPVAADLDGVAAVGGAHRLGQGVELPLFPGRQQHKGTRLTIDRRSYLGRRSTGLLLGPDALRQLPQTQRVVAIRRSRLRFIVPSLTMRGEDIVTIGRY